MKLGGGGGIRYMEPTRGGGRDENKARNETPVLGSFKFNCLVPYVFQGILSIFKKNCKRC